MSSPLLQSSYNILCGAWRQRYTMFLPIILLPILGAIVSLLSTPRYTSHMSFLVQESGKDNPYLSDLSVETNIKKRMSGLKTLLHSRHILTKVIEELSTAEEPLSEQQMEREIELLSNAISINLVGSNLISINMRSKNPHNMEDTLSAISKHFISALLAPAQSSIRSSEQFLSEQLDLLEASLQQAETKMAEYKSTHADELPASHAVNMDRLRESQKSLAKKQVQLAGAKQVMKNLQNKVLELDPVLAQLETNLVKLKGELAMLSAKYTNKHSAVRGVLRQIKRLEEERQRVFKRDSVKTEDIERFWSIRQQAGDQDTGSDLLMSQISGLQKEQQDIRRLTEEVSLLEQNIIVTTKRVQSFGKNEKTLRELQREIDVKSKVYEDLLERYEKAQVTRSLGEFEAKDRIKVIDKPFNPIRPLNLPLIAFVIFGFIGGLLTGISFAVVNELMNHKLYNIEQIELITGVPVIARLPNFKSGNAMQTPT
ncbi:MAG: polysaccharide chain length determinant protein (PEP-CTERM system associated) [Phenylobacterium sp.]|jgi:polysaccharide chain length determinant protein (PEP-CTERM system associated)